MIHIFGLLQCKLISLEPWKFFTPFPVTSFGGSVIFQKSLRLYFGSRSAKNCKFIWSVFLRESLPSIQVQACFCGLRETVIL